MGALFIVVEGIEDENFIKQLLTFYFHDNPREIRFLFTGNHPYGMKDETIQTILAETSNLEEDVIFILDADDQLDNYVRILQQKFSTLERSNLFLVPDNGSPGNLETLLRQIVPEKYSLFLNSCIDNFASCVNDQKVEGYSVNEKDKLFIYASALTRKSGKGREREYSGFFDLNSPALTPLVNFLTLYLTP